MLTLFLTENDMRDGFIDVDVMPHIVAAGVSNRPGFHRRLFEVRPYGT